jgi:hypothetical protein
MSEPALPPDPMESPPSTPTHPFTPSGSFFPTKPPRSDFFSLLGLNLKGLSYMSLLQKHQKSDTLSPIPLIHVEIVHKFPQSDYWTLRTAQAITEAGEDLTDFCTTNSPSRLTLRFLNEIQKDYTTRTDLLFS